ncbi:TonB-dependent siderophore receptor [Pseudomonas sp. Gutcm_11s]|uniref:TonB-dependent siderophore receptor n=1 Tax=Pseudomonas sp. Gutcm_11s TaxID=3026088 RepID=UPI00235FDB6E|nr:TonB-dependent siderophore receptor [Pseudomonas sp. Gutcm_11s]MDD0841748.1 TonB-dependent siderophore receptor [Pseudomonas sp. Gutcm_11s]
MTHRHRLARTLLAGALLAAIAPLHAQAAEAGAEQRQYQFDIAAQPLLDALGEFTATTGIAVLRAADESLSAPAPAVRGQYSAEQALQLLLQGSGLSIRHNAQGALTLQRVDGSAIELPTTDIQASGAPSAADPVQGYVAKAATTGTKTDTPIIETPQSISVVTRDQITDIHAQNLRDALGYTAGVIATEADDRTTDGFILRGFQINGSTYRDGMRYMSNIYDGSQEPYGMERVEVLRGASSVLFGQAAPGGIINVVSKLPTREELHEIRAETGSNDRHQLATDHGGALTDTLSYRFTALERKSDTTVDHVPDDRTFIAPSITWQPTEATSLTLLATYQKSRTAYVYGLPAEGTVLPNPNGHISRHTFLGEPGYDKAEITAWDLGYRFEHAFSDNLKLRQNLRYFESENEMPSVWIDGFIDPQMTTVARGAQDRVDDSRNFVVDTQLEYRLHGERVDHVLLGGLDYGDRHLRTERYNRDLTPLNIFDPVYGGTFGPAEPAVFASYTSSTEQTGVYLQDQIKFDEKWVLLLGGRQDWAKQKEDAIFIDSKSDQDSDAFTKRAGLVYLADNGLAPFISYSESFEPQSGRDRSSQDFDPTEGEQYELGIRYQPPGSNSLYSAAIYQLTQSNVLTTDPVDTNYQVQTGEIRARGLELEAKTDIGADLSLTASYAYTEAEVTKSNTGTEGQKNGGMPRNMFSVWGDYRFGQIGSGQLRAGAGVRYVDEVPGLFNTDIVAPSYTLVDAMLGYEVGPWDMTLNVTNLTDEDYLSYTYAAFYGAERQITAGVAYRW